MAEEPKKPTILVVDDDSEIRYSLDRVLSGRGYQVAAAGSGEDGVEMVRTTSPDIVFLDIRMGGMSGIETLQHMRAINNRLPIILMTAFGTAQTAIEAMKYGAFDYIMKPFDPVRVTKLAEAALKALHDMHRAGDYEPRLRSEDWKEGIVGTSAAMQEVFKIIGQVAASDATVLVTGESGTGKELIARCIVQHSLRARGAYAAVNCAAIPENLIESELFGHEKGSFTGATAQRLGKFEQCDGGTIFLDEIGDMTLATQTKILRVLQEGEIQRVGGSEIIKVDVRVVAATNKDIEEMVRQKTFREDLYYRLNVVRVRVPPLRDRVEDVPEIVEFMLQRLEKNRKSRVRRVAPEAMAVLSQHTWPGNVRELENVIHRSAVVAQGDTILLKDFPPELRAGAEVEASVDVPTAPAEPGPQASSAPSADAPSEEPSILFDRLFACLQTSQASGVLKQIEGEMIRRALNHFSGDPGKAAEFLGLSRNVLKKRSEDLGI